VAEKAIKGIVKISPEGSCCRLRSVPDGINLDFYREIPLTSMPYGQAMAILCLTEYLRKFF
jgi:unsaturated rhamnogalacturonyl hydrolase